MNMYWKPLEVPERYEQPEPPTPLLDSIKNINGIGPYFGYCRICLVPSFRRTIRILISSGVVRHLNERDLEFVAATAAKKGWRTVCLQRDDCMGDTVEMLNMHQYHYNYNKGRSGIYVCCAEGL